MDKYYHISADIKKYFGFVVKKMSPRQNDAI